MYQTKPRLNAFNQPSFLRHNSRPRKPVDTFWDEDDIRPFRLSIPEHFNPTPDQTSSRGGQQKRNNSPLKNQETAQNQPYQRSNRPANSPRQKQYAAQPRTFPNRQSESYIYNRPHSTLVSYLTQRIYTNWIEKELYFSMNKLSFLVLVIGLFFLSSLLFITGFLVAVNIYDIGTPKILPMTNMNIPTPSINMHTMETPRLPAPPAIAMPGIPTPIQNLPTTPPVMMMPAVAAPLPTMPNPNIMKMGSQGTQMADTPIANTARIPSAYVQPAQALAPAQQQAIHQSGAHNTQQHQQMVAAQHMPSQGYTQQQNPYPPQTVPIQASAHQQQLYTQHNQTTQHYYPQNPSTYHQTGGR